MERTVTPSKVGGQGPHQRAWLYRGAVGCEDRTKGVRDIDQGRGLLHVQNAQIILGDAEGAGLGDRVAKTVPLRPRSGDLHVTAFGDLPAETHTSGSRADLVDRGVHRAVEREGRFSSVVPDQRGQ
jgi:hypothetical protein